METVHFKSKAEQVADFLREQIQRGRWTDTIPGRLELAKEVDVNNKTIELAIRQLEQEKLLVPQGAGKRRKIVLPENSKIQSLRIAILYYEPQNRSESYLVELVHQLADAGHTVISAQKTLMEMHMTINRVAQLVTKTNADAWIVVGGSSEVLNWFSQQKISVFAVFGRRRSIPIAGAGPDKLPAISFMTQRLIELGHKRIVMLVRKERRTPVPGAPERMFLSTLEANGIQPSGYHLPEWDESPDGLHRCFDGLFRLTPPTAIIVDEAAFITAALQFFTKRGIRTPEDVSVICCDDHPTFSWCKPAITHIRWDSQPVVRRIVKWADNISHKRQDTRQTETKAQFIEGGTIGPAPMT